MNWAWYQKLFIKRMDRYVAAHDLATGTLSENEIADILSAVAEEMRTTYKLDAQTHQVMKDRMKALTFRATKRYW